MNRASLLAFFAAILATVARADDPNPWQGKKVPSLVLADGKTYSQVTFTKVEPDAVSITHAGGLVRIPMEDLTEEARKALGYDPEKAAESRAKFLADKAAGDAAAAQRAAANQAAMAEQMANAAAQADREKKLAAAETRSFIVLSVTPDGPLVNTYSAGGFSRTQSAISSITGGGGGGGGGMISAKRGDKVFLLKGYKGKPLVDDDTFTATYIETDETYQYESSIGASVTVSVIEALSVENGE